MVENNGYVRLKEFFTKNKIKIKELAGEMGMSRSHLSKKIHRIDGADFKPDEIRYICKRYRLDANEFFLLSPLRNSNGSEGKAS